MPTFWQNKDWVIDSKGARKAGTLGEETTELKYIRETSEKSLYYFSTVIMGGLGFMQPRPHKEFADFLQQIPPYRKLLLAPRGHLKSTLARDLVLHVIIQPDGSNCYFPNGIGYLNHSHGTSTRILLASKTASLAQSQLRAIKASMTLNQKLRVLWPDRFWENPRRETTTWSSDKILLPRREYWDKNASIETIGVGGTKTGYHFNLHVNDDLIDIEDRNSPTTMATAFEWFSASRAFMDDQAKALEFTLGTHWATHDLYTQIRENDPTVTCEVWSAIEDGSPLWPEQFPEEVLATLRMPAPQGVGDMFPLLYMNDPYATGLVEFNIEQVRDFAIQSGIISYEKQYADTWLEEFYGYKDTKAPGSPRRRYSVDEARRQFFEQRYGTMV